MKMVMVIQAVIVLLIMTGCSTSSGNSVPLQPDVGITLKGVTATNAVITKSDGKYFYYREKCSACGFVSPRRIGSVLPEKFCCKSEFVCPMCGKVSQVSIKKDR